VFSMYFSVALLPSLLGLVGIGFFADTIGLAQTDVLLGGVVFVLGIVSFMIPALRELGKKGVIGKASPVINVVQDETKA